MTGYRIRESLTQTSYKPNIRGKIGMRKKNEEEEDEEKAEEEEEEFEEEERDREEILM